MHIGITVKDIGYLNHRSDLIGSIEALPRGRGIRPQRADIQGNGQNVRV
jgi:hypothetical protein